MRQSELFYKTLREIPREAEAASHQFLLRAGFIDQVAAGVFTFLPLGIRVLNKIENIIRNKMQSKPISGQEILMPALTPKENWQATGRWETFDSLFKLKGAGDKDYALGPTHEEIVVPLAKKFVFSYNNLPFAVFQIQTKFRNELRVKSGLLRTREFLMKDLYSFHATEDDLEDYYQKIDRAYVDIFDSCGLKPKGKERKTYKTLASGGSFSKYSNEYQTITSFGEDTIYICEKCLSAINAEVKEESNICPACLKSSSFTKSKAIEVGNIFKLGTKFSLPFNLKFKNKTGQEKPVIMGCYGIGLGRLMAAAVEINRDDKGIIWPEKIAPFNCHLIPLEDTRKVKKAAEGLYEVLIKDRIETLFDDRKGKTAGEKFAEADLIGLPKRIVVSEKTLKKRGVEIKDRSSKEMNLVKIKDIRQNPEKFLK